MPAVAFCTIIVERLGETRASWPPSTDHVSHRPNTEPREIELWLCAYSAGCSAPGCWRLATTKLRYVDRQGRPDRQVDVCDINTTALCADLKVIDRGRRYA
jgi:hypothetical protein